jgi:hypothetical protein
LVKEKKGDLLADPHKILNRWKNYLSDVARSGVTQKEMHTAEPFVPEATASEPEVVAGKLKSV